MKTKKLLVIGGGGAGMFSAIVATQLKPKKFEATILSDEKDIYCRCSTPYILTKKANLKDAIQPDSMIEDYGVTLVHEKAVQVDIKNKKVITNKNNEFYYDKLVIASGARAFRPPIKGLNSKKVFTVRTSEDVKNIYKQIKKNSKVVVIGGGIIGVEMAGALDKRAVKTDMLEVQHQLLSGLADTEYTLKIHDLLESKGVNIHFQSQVVEIKTKRNGSKVVLAKVYRKGLKELPADFVIVAVGVRANIDFLEGTGIKLDSRQHIIVNNKMRTSHKNIYACGDCTSSKHAITGEITPIPLASTAIHQAKIVAYSLAGFPIKYHGHTNACAFETFDTEYAEVGLSEEATRKRYKIVVVGRANTTDIYKDMKAAKPLELKLIFAGLFLRLVGAQAYGKGTVTPIEIASFAMSQRLHILKMLRYNYLAHPSLSSWPFMNPIIMATEDALGKVMKWFRRKK